jgi:alkylation response protein AidB-like acyl-CoA dehydrogenase
MPVTGTELPGTDLPSTGVPSTGLPSRELSGTGQVEGLRSRFAPVFALIRDNVLEHEHDRSLPYDEVRWLAEAGFGALRLPDAEGGGGVSVAEFFAILTDLAAADSNQPQIWRNHIAFVEATVTAAAHEAAAAVYEAQITTTDEALTAATVLFDALGSSALDISLALDRHWRNARAITSHNPRVYKERLVGAWHLNGTPPIVYGEK